MLLAIDIGNTNITLGAFKGDKLACQWRLATDLRKTSDEYGTAILSCLKNSGKLRTRLHVGALVYGSVVPSLNPVFDLMATRYFGHRAVAIDAKTRLGIRLDVDFPEEVGADRLLNVLAAYRLYGGPAVVLDFGTATTFDCLSKEGAYLGGAILIGPGLAAQALHDHTAQLPRVEICKTERVIGKNTVECIQAGLFYGYLGMVENVLKKTISEMRVKDKAEPKVLATGGLAELFAGHIPMVRKVIPDLTLQGLRLAYKFAKECG